MAGNPSVAAISGWPARRSISPHGNLSASRLSPLRDRLLILAEQLFEPVHRVVGARAATTAASLLGAKLVETGWQGEAATTAAVHRLAAARKVGPDDPLGHRQLQRVDAATAQVIAKQLQGAIGPSQTRRLVVV